jgi:ribonucleoside-diphosphate reductase alpha subunit|tara:strand:+ start:575 stop:3091 length:2517 start_codon:yes stop_codon:yes gene_type:complete
MSADDDMKVIKRNGGYEDISFDKILNRVKNLSINIKPQLKLNYSQLVMDVIDQIYPNIPTTVLDELTAQQCASLCTKHYDYGILASRIIISNSHKNTSEVFSDVVNKLYNFKDVHGVIVPLIHEDLFNTVEKNKEYLNNIIDYQRDYEIDYFGFKTLERAYLMKIDGKIMERPQHMWLRVALGIHGDNMDLVKETYDLMSQKYFTHATPTLYNAGTPRPQLSSCYLLSMEDDSIDGIYDTLKDCAKISKWAGGIGLHIHNVRGQGSHIRGTNGTSNGIVPMLQVYNKTARYVDQGGGKRNGSFAIYLEPWHSDIEEFLELKKNHGDEEQRARDLFYALWIPSLFMEKITANEDWCLFCPDKCPGLADCYGDKFKLLYDKYESENKQTKKINARTLWYQILDSQMETGTPYLLYKDHANEKSNQKNLGVIKSSNLCTEIIEYSNKDETAVCNLASIGLSKFVKDDKTFDYIKLHEVTKVVANNLDKIIDVNYYPTDKTQRSNFLHRPIGIGIQGLADVFAMMDLPFCSDKSKEVNKLIFETIYHASLEKSNELAIERCETMMALKKCKEHNVELFVNSDKMCREYTEVGKKQPNINVVKPIRAELENSGTTMGSYSSFVGSPTSYGILQFDMWSVKPSNMYDWDTLKSSIKMYGLRNSLSLAPMPTASTSQILGNNECFEPFTSNIYSRRTMAGDYVVVNKHLMHELTDLGLWDEKLKNNIILNKGSIQHINGIPDKIKEKYKIVWEIPMKELIDMAADRGAFICQSQSMNLWIEDPDYKKLTSMHFYSWKKGLKTGIYYLRRKPRHQSQQFTIEPEKNTGNDNDNENDEDEDCLMCGA